MRRGRRRRKVGKHISLSATDADWETVRSNANRRGLSIARYLVELVERDASEEDAGLELTLAAEEQRELLEAVREVRALMLEGEDAGPLVRDMQERIAVQFAAWASALVTSGRSEELRAALASVVGEERARIAAAPVVASVAPSAAKRLCGRAADGARGGGADRRGSRRALCGADQPPQRLPGPGLGDPRRHGRAENPEAEEKGATSPASWSPRRMAEKAGEGSAGRRREEGSPPRPGVVRRAPSPPPTSVRCRRSPIRGGEAACGVAPVSWTVMDWGERGVVCSVRS